MFQDQYKFCFKLLWDYLNTRLAPIPITRYSSEDYLDSFSIHTGHGGTLERPARHNGTDTRPMYMAGTEAPYDNPSYSQR